MQNDFVPFAVGGNANVVSQAQYLALPQLGTGFGSGPAASSQFNKVWRQASIMSSVIAQFINQQTGQNTLDDGTTATLLANLTNASMVGTAPRGITAATGTMAANDRDLIINYAGTCTLTLLAAASASAFLGKELIVKTITANAVVSAAANVVPIGGGAAGTAILAATAGKWARLVWDGTYWQTMAAN